MAWMTRARHGGAIARRRSDVLARATMTIRGILCLPLDFGGLEFPCPPLNVVAPSMPASSISTLVASFESSAFWLALDCTQSRCSSVSSHIPIREELSLSWLAAPLRGVAVTSGCIVERFIPEAGNSVSVHRFNTYSKLIFVSALSNNIPQAGYARTLFLPHPYKSIMEESRLQLTVFRFAGVVSLSCAPWHHVPLSSADRGR
jgi:hypothetical protein